MQETHSIMLPVLGETIRTVLHAQVPDERKAVLQPLVNYVQARVDTGDEINLNFICTHNSRRSQFSQIWAKTASEYFGLKTNCFSGGIEVTAFNERAVSAIERSGFAVTSEGSTNPHYAVRFSAHAEPIAAFSKMYDDPENASGAFAAVMTCSHAEENCPFIPGAEKRISVHYEDPKDFDGLPEETAKYDERCMQIAAEMFFVFSKIEIDK